MSKSSEKRLTNLETVCRETKSGVSSLRSDHDEIKSALKSVQSDVASQARQNYKRELSLSGTLVPAEKDGENPEDIFVQLCKEHIGVEVCSFLGLEIGKVFNSDCVLYNKQYVN